jgi:hypothetical protein
MQKAGKILRQLRQNLIKAMQMERQNRRTEQLGLDRLMAFEEEKEVKNGLEENDCDDEGRGEQEQQHGEEGKGPAVADEIFVAEEEQRTGEQSAADEGKEKDELFAEAPGIAELNREIAPLLYQVRQNMYILSPLSLIPNPANIFISYSKKYLQVCLRALQCQ